MFDNLRTMEYVETIMNNKKRKGRPKGYVPHLNISYEELGEWAGAKTKIPVCKKWLALVGYDIPTNESEETEANKILDDSQVKPTPTTETETPKIECTLTNF